MVFRIAVFEPRMRPMINARFVGGPADGLTQVVEDLKRLEIGDVGAAKTAWYRRLSYTVVPPEGAIYVPDEWTDDDAAAALIKEYVNARLEPRPVLARDGENQAQVIVDRLRIGKTALQNLL